MQLTNELLAKVAKLPKAARQKALLGIGMEEFERCANDAVYWFDNTQHLRTARWPEGMPYVFTKDPHPLYRCKECTLEVMAENRADHLQITHNFEGTPLLRDLNGAFVELPPIRPMSVNGDFAYLRPIIEWWQKSQYLCIEKSRDMMGTWIVVAMSTWDAMFHKGRQHIFQSQDAPKTLELVQRADLIYRNQPAFLREAIGQAYFSKGGGRSGELYFTGQGSEILGFPQGPDQIRQFHPSCVFTDETAFQVEAAAGFAAIQPSIRMGGKYVGLSSANRSFFELLCRDRSDE